MVAVFSVGLLDISGALQQSITLLSLSLLPIKATNHWGSDKSCQRRAELWLYCTVHIEESPACLPSVRIEKISLSLSPYPPFSPLTAVHQVVINQRNGDGRTNVCLRWIWERGKKGWKWEKWEQPAVLVFLSPFSVCVHYMWGFHTRSTTIKYKGGKRSIRHMNPDLLPGWLTFGARDIWLLLLLLPAPFFLISQWQAMLRSLHPWGEGEAIEILATSVKNSWCQGPRTLTRNFCILCLFLPQKCAAIDKLWSITSLPNGV